MLRTSDLDYHLPEGLIATTPVEPRDNARLLVVRRSSFAKIEDCTVRNLTEILRTSDALASAPDDVLVVNESRVLPARFRGVRLDTRGQAEGLFVSDASDSAPGSPRKWTVLLKMRRLRPGLRVGLLTPEGKPSPFVMHLLARESQAKSDNEAAEPSSGWLVEIESVNASEVGRTTIQILDRVGLTPVPPYILAARRRAHAQISESVDRAAYQTVYAQSASGPLTGSGSVAAPTAGLHFTPELLSTLETRGVQRSAVFLDVGLGTFKPVETEFIQQHPMHSEWCTIPAATGAHIARTRAAGGRVIAVGTTAARTLESFSPAEVAQGGAKNTRLLITPGHRFQNLDALMTNFHLPKTTLLAMIAAALVPTEMLQDNTPLEDIERVALERMHRVYNHAVAQRYRFYSYGDAMLILP